MEHFRLTYLDYPKLCQATISQNRAVSVKKFINTRRLFIELFGAHIRVGTCGTQIYEPL